MTRDSGGAWLCLQFGASVDLISIFGRELEPNALLHEVEYM